MAKYGPETHEVVEREMKEFKEGTLRMGRSGKKVTNPKQAIAIALSEARREGDKVPPAPAGTPSAAKESTDRKAANKPGGTKKTAPKKAAAKKPAPKKTSSTSAH